MGGILCRSVYFRSGWLRDIFPIWICARIRLRTGSPLQFTIRSYCG